MQKKYMENQYLNYYKNHSIKELLEVAGNAISYNDEARLAAYKILQQKNVELSEDQIAEIEAIEDSFIRQERVQKQEEKEKEVIHEWYSPVAVLGFSIFLGPVFGAFLLFHNLKKAKKKVQANYVILVGILFLILRMTLVFTKNMSQMISLGISIIAGLIFIELFWKKHLGYQVKYKRKPIWKVLLVILGIFAIIIGVQVAMDPEGFKELLEQQQALF